MQTVENFRNYDLVEITVDIAEFSGRKLRTPFFFHSLHQPQQKCGLHTPWVLTKPFFTVGFIASTAETVDDLRSRQSEVRWVACRARQLER